MTDHERRPDRIEPDLRAVLAAERTLLAWIRTGVAMMGFGFIVARFGLFLYELARAQGAASIRSSGLSLWTGSALVLLGVAVNLLASFRYAAIVRSLRRGEPVPWPRLSLGIAASVVLAILGLAMVVYLLSVRRE